MPASTSVTKLLPLVLLTIGLTALAMMFLQYQDSRYKPLFGARETVPAADMMSVLDEEKIAYRIHPDSGQVLVPEDMLGRVRMLLAAKGVIARLPAGLEQADKSDPLGVNQFVQDIRFRRGLEGELTQSIVTLEPVESARVHLSIAKSSSFILGDGDKSSASVVLRLKPGRTLSAEQVSAIVAMVAGSVANLDPARVAVVDQAGHYLSASDQGGGSPAEQEVGARMRDDALRNIQTLLAPALGDGNFRASVAVELNRDRIEETREQYGEAPKVTQEATRKEDDVGAPALGVPGSLSNRPAVARPASDAGEGPRSQRNATTRQYAYDRSVVQTRRAPTVIKRMSVAVVLNDAIAPAGGKTWTRDQLANIESILRNGLGIDSERGDQLLVSGLSFQPAPPVEEVPWWRERDNLVTIGSYAGYALLALLAFLLVLRPLIRILRQWVAKQQDPPRRAADEAMVPALPAPDDVTAMAGTSSSVALPLLTEIKLPPIGSDVDVLVEHLRAMVGQDPERVAEVIKPWIRKDGQSD
nr:flagellar basal-body MS-ring/collar protein FliF [Caballeronia sp. dw_19]